MRKTRGYAKAAVRSFVPIAGISIMAVLSEDPRLFWSVVLPLLAGVLPLSAWLTKRILCQAGKGARIYDRFLVLQVFALSILAAGVCFCFMIEAGVSHGAVLRNLFFLRCIFACIVLVVYPVTDLTLSRASLLSDMEGARINKSSVIVPRAVILAAAASVLIRIIAPPLNTALRLQHRNVAKLLVSFGADVRASDRYGCSPLWYAVHRTDLEMTNLLLEKGAQLDAALAGLGLQRAAEGNRPDMLRFLLSRGANPNSTHMGATALILACLRNDRSMIRLLLDNGADMNVKGGYPGMPYDGKSALDLALASGDAQTAEIMLAYRNRKLNE